MKNAFVAFVFSMTATAGYSTTINAVCTNKSNSGFIEDKTIKVALTPKEITIASKNLNVSGSFDRVIKNGSSLYSSPALTDLCDQCDIGNIFISPDLAKGRKGQLDFSVRQLGDSEGYAWLKESFSCIIK